ncbi:Lar family restriction alleviation protein [Pseudomonas sp. D5002]|uniref:Lar family restriction alleviation protein n=1 Tax=Pseudomonas sp. D5002 TaxID=2738818 RepID=UPI0015A1B0EC|nr:Lar family restriction alleviation protein [Pseudomonas sp. D5002]
MNEPTKMSPCAFCGGPPVTIITTAFFPRQHVDRAADYGEDGLSVEARVYCHECGASGETAEDEIYDAESYDDVILDAIGKWNLRDKRHADLYESSDSAGRNLYPRADS